MKKLFFLSFLLSILQCKPSDAQSWVKYGPNEGFPSTTWDDVKDSFHPTLSQYDGKVMADYRRTKKEFEFQSFWFDTEQLDHLEDFSALMDSILYLLPQKCNYKILKTYTNEQTKRWTIDIKVNKSPYQFSTQAIGGIFMDTENLFANLEKVLTKHAPEYEVIIPDIPAGQDMEIMIEKKAALLEASKKGFPYPPFKIEWKKKTEKGWRLYLPDCNEIQEDQLNEAYIKTFNELFVNTSPQKQLSSDNFHICNIQGNGLFYIYLNGKNIGTPSRFDKQWQCGFSLSEFIFGYVLAEMNGCTAYLDDIWKKERKELSLKELREMILSGVLGE